jgi:hypothetical protein
VEIAIHDIAEVQRTRLVMDRLLGTSTLIVHSRRRHGTPFVALHVRRGAQLAAVLELLAGDPRAARDEDAIRAALTWEPRADISPQRGAVVGLAAVLAAGAVVVGLRGSAATVVYPPDDAIYPRGVKRSREAIVRFMERDVMPWARQALAPIVGSPDRVTCNTCHGADGEDRAWRMPAVPALPERHFQWLGWELYSAAMSPQMRNAIYGYLAESDKQHQAAYMREVIMPGMARLLRRPAYDFTKSYEHNRTRLAFGCYHCHRLEAGH